MIVTLLFFLFLNNSMAMYGDLLPVELAPKSACKVSINNGESICSGTIIASNLLKTAAHCLRKKSAKDLKVFCPNGQIIAVKELLRHPDHGNIKNIMSVDIGLVVLDEDFEGQVSPLVTKPHLISTLLQNSRMCAVWSYGHNINNIDQLGELHGVAITHYIFEEPHVVIDNFRQVMVRSGDSGGGLFCLTDDDQWADVATVYGHDFESSYLLKNDNASTFFGSHQVVGVDVNITTVMDTPEDEPANLVEVEVGQVYQVKPFSLFYQYGILLGTGDQKKVYLKVESVRGDKAYGVITVEEVAPHRYLCFDGIACHGVYEKSTVERSRIIGR
jgi:hypothetical protein